MAQSRSPAERAEHYRDRAAKVRELAQTAPLGKSRDQLLDLADQYERLAASLEETRFF
jgi:hypothetical protein